ncbi:hypothetical protein R1sor_012210 [Riccia sorocarpa]|uniref:Protein kinase domain-containing protein n=1 Tax=Riccia sorocarpa TaxID=122646 RepID=A0ABD3I9C0_9MARC
MASGSRQDKGKASMIPEEDIGTEEGELVEQDPPRPEAVVRSDRERKRKQIAVEEDPLAIALRPAPENRTEAQRKQAIKEERYRQDTLFRHRAAMKNEEEQDKWRTIAKKWMRWFAAKKTITDFGSTSGKYKLCESVSDNTIRFISPEDSLTRTDETTVLGEGRMGTTHRVGIIDEELAEVLGHHEIVHYALRVRDKKVHEKCIREMMAFPESHSAIIRPIGLSKDKKKPMLLFPLWNGGTIEKWMNLEKKTRGRISPEGIPWDWNQTKNRADSGKDKDNKPLKPVIIRSLVFVGISDIGKAQTLKEVAKDFDLYPVADTTFRPWIAPELNIHKATKIDAENPFITKLSPESDIFALGWLIKELCGDYFTDMTDEERREYNRTSGLRRIPKHIGHYVGFLFS